MISLLLSVGSVSAGFAGPYIQRPSFQSLDTSSTGAYIQRPFQNLDTSSIGAYTQQPLDTSSMRAYIQQPAFQALDTSSTGAYLQRPAFQALDTSSMGSYMQQPAFQALDTSSMRSYTQQTQPVQRSWSAQDTSSMGSYIQQPAFQALDTSSMGSYTQQTQPVQRSWSAQDTSSMGAFVQRSSYPQAYTGYGPQAMESASATNPYNANMLNQHIAPLTTKASKVMPVRQIMGGEQHVVENDLQLHVNHEADKTVLTKRLVHHSPVLHKTIRTHQIAQDVVHDKQVHHMNVVEDRVKQVRGQEYIGTKQQVDHTTANSPAAQLVLTNKINMNKKF